METCWLRNSCIVYEDKTKDCAPSWTFQPKILASLFTPLMFAGLHNHSPLLIMAQLNALYHNMVAMVTSFLEKI